MRVLQCMEGTIALDMYKTSDIFKKMLYCAGDMRKIQVKLV